MFIRTLFSVAFCLLLVSGYSQSNPQLQAFANDFFNWRARTQPAAPDDIPRVERPIGWTPDFSPQALEANGQTYINYKKQLMSLSGTSWTRSDSIDFLRLNSAVEHVNCELNVLRLPYRNPDFYVHR